LGYQDKVKFKHFSVDSIVASANVRFPIRLESLSTRYRAETSFEPERFPGLVFKIPKPRVTALIYVSGRMIFTGANSKKDVAEAFAFIYPILLQFRT
jgi:transcription initiation factor TFIID TATA-box-binding protein